MRYAALSLAMILGAFPITAQELFRDLALRHGFNLSAVTSRSTPLVLGPILQGDQSATPQWRLAQWGTRYNLEGAPVSAAGESRIVENEGKRIVVHPGGLAGEGVTLTVLGGVEYGGQLRTKGEPWPHLLVEQAFPDTIRLADYARLDFALDFQVLRCAVASKMTVDPGLHTGQITAFFAVRNENRESADFNDMIWFGLPIFDVRHDYPRGHQAVDGGKDDATGKFICTLPGERFYTTPTGDGRWHELRGDLVALIQEALSASQAKGFLTDSTLDDLSPSSFNLGWEVPGPYDCEITLKGLSLMGRAEKDLKD